MLWGLSHFFTDILIKFNNKDIFIIIDDLLLIFVELNSSITSRVDSESQVHNKEPEN